MTVRLTEYGDTGGAGEGRHEPGSGGLQDAGKKAGCA